MDSLFANLGLNASAIISLIFPVATDMVNVKKYIPDVIIASPLPYATRDNFTGHQLYPINAKAYLRRGTLKKLKRAANEFRKLGYRIKIWDAYRPHSIQYKMWEVFPNPNYLRDPAEGSKHNRGAAVDMTLADMQGNEILMPTEFDNFTVKAHGDCYDLPKEEIKNRELLKRIMVKHGFKSIPREWWHFDDADWRDYRLLDIPFDKL